MLKGIHSIHFIGIGGISMSGLARALLEMGYEISGSDIRKNRLTQKLQEKGATIYQGHHPSHLGKPDLVVISSVIGPDNPELKETKRRKIPLISRGHLLAHLVNKKETIIVAGTHGKTTAASLIGLVLSQGEKDPTIFIGGELKDIGSNSKLGTSQYAVVESDESDGSFLLLFPKICVLTSLEDDHLDYYHSPENLLQAFVQFTHNLKPGGTLMVNGDDPRLRKLLKKICLHPSQKLLTYGIDRPAHLLADKIELKEFSSHYRIRDRERPLAEIDLPLVGRHNIYNSLAAVSVGINLGLDLDTIKKALSSFQGIKRRFERIGKTPSDILVMDDFAYHPTQIRAMLRVARKLRRRIIAVFQPHRYSRTKLLFSRFIQAFEEADILIITEIYAAGEDPLPGIKGKLLFEEVRRQRKNRTYYLPHKEEIVSFLREKTKEGDLVLTLGAGDIGEIGRKFLNLVR